MDDVKSDSLLSMVVMLFAEVRSLPRESWVHRSLSIFGGGCFLGQIAGKGFTMARECAV